MNILFCGHFLEQSGWGVAGRGYLKALNRTGHNVIARPIKPNPNTSSVELDDELNELVNKSLSLSSIDICIQHVLPHFLTYDNRVKNIALFVAESSGWGKATNWYRRLNLMDEIWFPNQFMVDFADDEGINKPVKLVPHTFDQQKYQQRYTPLDIPYGQGTYKFYYIGEFIRRKMLGRLIQTFHLTFRKNENVQLIIKTGKGGISVDSIKQEVEKICSEIKTAIKLYPHVNDYLHEVIIVDYLSENDIIRLHESCNCFVNVSGGESWCIPAFDAMAMGNTVISTPLGVDEYLKHYKYGYKLDGVWQPCIGATDTIENLNSARELWYYADVIDLCYRMRYAYEKHQAKYREDGLKVAQQYSYEAIADRMKELL